MDRFLGTAGVDKAYGEPVVNGDTVIIPTAEVVTLAGFGVGSWAGTSTEGEGGEMGVGEGGGGAGGGKTFSRPVAVVISSPEGVRVEPVFDFTKIALAAITAWGFMLTALLRMKRRR
ncbi:MAG: hypothetical protein GTO18_06090 [Anaerolineales bacterium]|nr:hypothetical protein [Anaerolineales bacterium]